MRGLLKTDGRGLLCCCTLGSVLLWGCQAQPADPAEGAGAPAGGGTSTDAGAGTGVAPRAPLAEATLVRLAPATLSSAQPRDASGSERAEIGKMYLDALWREAVRQSTRFDIAAGIEDTTAEHELLLHYDQESRLLTSALRTRGEAPVPLASAPARPNELPAALDALALASRRQMGESVVAALPAAKVYSSDPACVRHCERALREGARGDTVIAVQLLRRARPLDPGCSIVLAGLAALLLDHGEVAEAQRVAEEALALEARLAPTTRHRLARVLLCARADDRGLLALADKTLRERPHDPHAHYSRVLALSVMGNHREAAPGLRTLARRWPQNGTVQWHLCFAELASGDAPAALAAIEAGERRLRRGTALRPKALALFHCGRHEELRELLAVAAAEALDSERQDDVRAHALCHMRASHALLTGRKDDAGRLLLEDLEWLRQRPAQWEPLARDVAETGEVLVRLGMAGALRERLAALAEAAAGAAPRRQAFASVLAYLDGLVAVTREGRLPEAADAALRREGQTAWRSRLRAALHHKQGELQEEARTLQEVVDASDDPLARAALAQALRAAGQDARADALLADLRAQLLAFPLRQPTHHPLMSPARALAFLATERRSPATER